MYIRRSIYVLCLRGALGSISTQFSDFAKGFLSAYLGLSAFREATLIPCFFVLDMNYHLTCGESNLY